MDTRKEDIKTLQEMWELQKNIQRIIKKLAQLDNSEANVAVSRTQYDTTHEVKCNNEKKETRQQIADTYISKEKKAVSKFSFVPWIGIAGGIAVAFFAKEWLLAIGLVILGFILKYIITRPISKKIIKEHEDEQLKLEKEFETRLKIAKEEDKKEELRYRNDVESARQEQRDANRSKREELRSEKKQHEEMLKKIQIIPTKDMDNIPMLLDILESCRADNIKEALLEMDKQKRRIEEEKREEEKRRQAEEDARLAAMPGKVHIRIGSVNSNSGKLQTKRNSIYIDGVAYGFGNANAATTFQLNPGPHNIYAQIQEVGNIYTTPTQSFVLNGDGNVYVKIKLVNLRPIIRLCSSMSDLMED